MPRQRSIVSLSSPDTPIPMKLVSRELRLPFYTHNVRAGFPSPADDYQDTALDLNTYLIKHPAATFFVRVEGESMTGAGIFPGDLLIVDRAVQPRDGLVVLAVLNGDFTLKRLSKKKGKKIRLIAENPDYPDIEPAEEAEFQIWGVVVSVIHNPN